MNFNQMLELNSYELIEYINHDHFLTLPEVILTVDDLQEVGMMLPKLINSYTFLASFGEYAKIMVRNKKGKITKDEMQELMGKRDIITQAADTVKMQYNALSRMITVKQEINNELRMSDARY